MKNSEQFAIDEWLSDYPKDMTFDEIVQTMKFDDPLGQIVVFEAVDSKPMKEVALYMLGTKHHYEWFVEGKA